MRFSALAGWLALAMATGVVAAGQAVVPAAWPDAALAPQAAVAAQPLAEDRGAAAVWRDWKQLDTWASLMMIVAHPDDEDGGMLTYESRGLGVRTSLLTLTRGEGGQNAMAADTYDALGLIRTNELLKAGEYYGVRQYWGTEADFGFSKTLAESFARWGHERVLCDAVLAIRQERPLVLVSSFIGGVTDGHGHHQVSGEIAQEAFEAAGDAKVCPEQIAAGFKPWAPLAVYARVPSYSIGPKGIYDYATGKWAAARFYNYIARQWSNQAPSVDAKIPSGSYDPALGRTYFQIARQGWGEQKSQYGGAIPPLAGPVTAEYHLYASRAPEWRAALTGPWAAPDQQRGFFRNMPVGLAGMEWLARSFLAGDSLSGQSWLAEGLNAMQASVDAARAGYSPATPEKTAAALKAGYRAATALLQKVRAVPDPDPPDRPGISLGKAYLASELERKIEQFQVALQHVLGLEILAFVAPDGRGNEAGPFGGSTPELSARSVVPGERFQVRVHLANAYASARLKKVWLVGADGKSWSVEEVTPETQAPDTQASTGITATDRTFRVTVPEDAPPTRPYFTRPSIEQPYYDIADPALRGRSFAPYPLTAWAEFDYGGLPIRMGRVVQTMQRELGPGGVYEPLVVTPKVGVELMPTAQILPIAGGAFPARVTVHCEAPAEGTLELKLPPGWSAEPKTARFERKGVGNTDPIAFQVTPASGAALGDGAFTLAAVVHADGRDYTEGWQRIGYRGLLPYNLYRKAEMKARAVEAKVAPSLLDSSPRVGYVMGTGDTVPQAIEQLGVAVRLLTADEVLHADLSGYKAIVIGIRAYSVRPELTQAEARLMKYVQSGGTLIVQYQGNEFPAPYPLKLGAAEKVVEEAAPVKILAPDDPLVTWPNRIAAADFNGWVEERGHSFLESWDGHYVALTETADAGQDPQRGGLLVAHPDGETGAASGTGKGTYVYVAYALYRQLPELVPGAYRLLANLLSAGEQPPR